MLSFGLQIFAFKFKARLQLSGSGMSMAEHAKGNIKVPAKTQLDFK